MVQDELQDGLGLSTVLHLVRHAQDVAGLPDEVVQVGVLALVRELGQPHLLLRELIVQVEQFQRGVGQFLQDGEEDSRRETCVDGELPKRGVSN